MSQSGVWEDGAGLMCSVDMSLFNGVVKVLTKDPSLTLPRFLTVHIGAGPTRQPGAGPFSNPERGGSYRCCPDPPQAPQPFQRCAQIPSRVSYRSQRPPAPPHELQALLVKENLPSVVTRAVG